MNIKDFDRLAQGHDWYYTYNDDLKLYQRGREQREALEKAAQTSPQHDKLWRTYVTYYRDVNDENRSRLQALLESVRIEVGATTREELDAIVRELAEREAQYELERKARARRRHEEQLQRLVRLHELCRHHEWFYWKRHYNSQIYQQGSREREEMLKITYFSYEQPELAELFRAWANCANSWTTANIDALSALMEKLQLDR